MLINFCPQLLARFVSTAINFRAILHHVCDVVYDGNMCGAIRTGKCCGTNWIINFMLGHFAGYIEHFL